MRNILVIAGVIALAGFLILRSSSSNGDGDRAANAADADGTTPSSSARTARERPELAATHAEPNAGDTANPYAAGRGPQRPRREAPEDVARAGRLAAAAAARRQPPAGPHGELTTEEARVMSMYDDMVSAFDQHKGDCDAIGTAIENVVDEHQSDVVALTASRANLPPEQASDSRARVEEAAGDRLERIRASLRRNLATCAGNAKLLGALRKLAETQG